MAKVRFLRDRMLDGMLNEIQSISEKVNEENLSPLFFSRSFSSLSEMYETNKMILENLEEAIEQLRHGDPHEEIIDTVVKAAAHIQLSLVTIHTSIKDDINTLMEGITELQNTLQSDEE